MCKKIEDWQHLPLFQEWYMKPDRCRGKRKEAHYNYLTPDMQYLRSTKAAIAYLNTDDRYSQVV